MSYNTLLRQNIREVQIDMQQIHPVHDFAPLADSFLMERFRRKAQLTLCNTHVWRSIG